jgi:2-polyprenyl-3-methyl-5-hydroxy-6-metoxy-1,4-benzoquinol methylase
MSFQNNIFYQKTKDYSVSKETFDLHHNPEYDMLLTFPKPCLEDLPKYYESENYISHTDGKRSLFEKIYQVVKGIALRRKLKLINTISEKGTLLDIGAGTGDFLNVAQNDNWIVSGIEPNEKAKSIAISKGVSFVNDLKSLDENSFDVITMWHVLEHVPNLEEYILELKRLIKPSGTIIIAVPNYKSFDANYYQEYWAAFDVPRHLWHFSKISIEKLFAIQELKLVKVLPMKFDSYYVSLLSEKYKNGKMKFLNALWIGWKSNQYGKRKKEYSSHIYILKTNR